MSDLLTAIAVLFIAAGPFLLVANRISMPTAPALIGAGIVAGLMIDEGLVLEIARLGIAFLVFSFAVHIQTTDAEMVVAGSEVIAFVQLIVIGALGVGFGLAIGIPSNQAIFLGVAAALSSSIVGSTLFLPGNLELANDRLSESIHSVQDFSALFLLLVLGAGVFALDPIANNIGYGVMLVFLAIAINRYVYDVVGRFVGSGESMLIGTIALLLIFVGLAAWAELSIVVGAFAAGIAVRDDPIQYAPVLNGLDSITDFFAAIFFLTVGALLTIPTGEVFTMSVALVVLAGVVKPVLTIGLLMYQGYERRTATLTAFNLDQIGEFALIIAIEAMILGILFQSVFDAIILAAAITLVTSSFTRYYEERIYQRLADQGFLGDHRRITERYSDVPATLTDHIVIIGYGRHGKRLKSVCERYGQSYVVIENDPGSYDELSRDCEAFVFGDIIEADTLEHANLRRARLVVSTPDSTMVNRRLMDFTDELDVIIRTKHLREAQQYLEEGAYYVSVTDLLAADRLAEHFEALFEREVAAQLITEEVYGELLTDGQPRRRQPARLVRDTDR